MRDVQRAGVVVAQRLSAERQDSLVEFDSLANISKIRVRCCYICCVRKRRSMLVSQPFPLSAYAFSYKSIAASNGPDCAALSPAR